MYCVVLCDCVSVVGHTGLSAQTRGLKGLVGSGCEQRATQVLKGLQHGH